MSSADAARLRLFQLVSPALPVGAFSYSEGLEVLVQSESITGVETLERWLAAELSRGALALEAAGLSELQAALQAAQRGGDLTAALEFDGWLLAQREAAELRAQQRQMGQSLLQLLADLGWPLPDAAAALAWPSAFAWAALCLEIGSPAVEEAYLYSWVANQISAAVRLIPLGPTQGQRLQLALAPLIAQRAQELAAWDARNLWNAGIGAGLAQLQHAELYSRLFRS
jgi:urease accessory protein